MNNIEYIRNEEKKYHDRLYENHKLFEEGTWLYKPVKTVISLLDYFKDRSYLNALDLGCGVGRNSIPIAKALKNNNGKVICVDLLDSALEKLIEYSQKHEVASVIETKKIDIEDFIIHQEEYDFIVAVSVLEHLSSKSALERKLTQMVRGTKDNGINCIVSNTNINEVSLKTNTPVQPMFEINVSSFEMLVLLDHIYQGWEIIQRNVKQQEFEIERNGEPIILTTDCITFVAIK